MAKRPPTTNVVRLPTAARRQVKQQWNDSTRAARQALREACPWPGEYKLPADRAREAKESAKPSIAHIPLTPALIIASAMYGMADEKLQQTVGAVIKLAALGRPCAATQDALLMIQAVTSIDTQPPAKIGER